MVRGGFATRHYRRGFRRCGAEQEGNKELTVNTEPHWPKVVSTRSNGWRSSEVKPCRYEYRATLGRGDNSDSSSTQFVESEGSQMADDSEASDVASPFGAGLSRLPSCSQGARMHDLGACRPCAWYWKPMGCIRAQDCGYCHLCPEGELKRRKKAKIVMIRGGNESLVKEQPREANEGDEDEIDVSRKYTVVVKNTFIHVEFDHVTSAVDIVTAAGITFVSVLARGQASFDRGATQASDPSETP